MSDTPRTDAMEYYFSNHDSCAGESLVRRLDEKDVTWEDSFMDDSVPADFARQLERELAAERALADRLAAEVEDWLNGGCAGDALAAWKDARREK